MVKGTINRKNLLKSAVLGVLRGSAKPMSTAEIASRLGKPWHSVHTRCLMLQIEGKVNGFRVGRMNLWVLKR